MIVNADITVYNKKYDPEDRTDYFIPTVINGVSLFYRRRSTISKGVQTKGLTAVIRIPTTAHMSGKEYVSPEAYRGYSSVDNFWTVQIGDLVVPCVVDDPSPRIDSELARDYEVIVVQEFTDNTTRGSENMKHWRIGGV
jgi:hypothetical protein